MAPATLRALLVALLVALTGCEKITGVNDLKIVTESGGAGAAGAAGAAGSPACVVDAPDGTCDHCVQTSCCAQALDCVREASCRACLADDPGSAGASGGAGAAGSAGAASCNTQSAIYRAYDACVFGDSGQTGACSSLCQ